MEVQTAITLIVGVAAVVSIILNVYKSWHNPQVKLEKDMEVSATEVDGKAALLAQQLNWEKESNALRFKDLSEAQVAATNLAQNHIHSVDVKVDQLTTVVNDMRVNITSDITKLSAIIEERIPKK